MPVGSPPDCSLSRSWRAPGRNSEPFSCTDPIWSGRRPTATARTISWSWWRTTSGRTVELSRRGFTHRPPRLMASLAWLLPPNVIAFPPVGADGPIAKCLIISARDFERELSARSRDHFMISRMIQEVGVLYVRDAAADTVAR